MDNFIDNNLNVNIRTHNAHQNQCRFARIFSQFYINVKIEYTTQIAYKYLICTIRPYGGFDHERCLP